MTSSAVLRVAGLAVLSLAAVAAVARPPLRAADVDEADVEMKVVEGGTLTNGVGMKFVAVRAGRFLMGAAKDEQGAERDEQPRHEVELTKDFYLGVTEVTQKQYKSVMGYNPSAFSSTGGGKHSVKGMDTDDFPAESVSWSDAEKFLAKLNGLSAQVRARLTYRLPTEAEWEYACRGGHRGKQLGAKAGLPFFFKTPSTSLGFGDANFNTDSPYGGGKKGGRLHRPCKTASYEPNALGLYDMHGNVWEWCSDWYSMTTYSEKDRKDPRGPAKGRWRVMRGGSWNNTGDVCRAARRLGYGPSDHSELVGFRVAATRAD